MQQQAYEQTLANFARLIPPAGIQTRCNGVILLPRSPIAQFEALLLIETADVHGYLKRIKRSTTIQVIECQLGEVAWLYEPGIPVVETQDRSHYNIGQKVPLSLERDGVPPAYLKDVRIAVVNQMHAVMTAEDINQAWVSQAVSASTCEPETIKSYLDKRFGEKRVSYDPSDPEANKLAVSKGYVIVTGNMLSKDAWKNAKAAEAIAPAGKVTPSPRPYSPEGPRPKLVPEPTPEMMQVAAYAQFLAAELFQKQIQVMFALEPRWPYAATYGGAQLVFNAGRLGYAWFRLPENRLAIDELLIHELGHEYSGDHLSEDYHKALCRIGARMAQFAHQWPAT